MKRFLKSFSLLLCSCLFAATGWTETIASSEGQLWATWNPMQLGAPITFNTQNDISAEGWRLVQGGANYMAHTLTPTVGQTAPYIDFGAEVGFGYDQNPSTIVATIKLPAEMTSETPKKLLTLAGYQNTTRFHLGLKSISATEGATFNVGYNNGNWQSPITVPDLKPGQKVTLALFYSKSGIVLSQINYRGATQLAKWNGMQASSNSCTRITFGAYHNTTAEIAFSVYGIEVYRNETNETALTFPVNLKQQINQEIIGINFSRKDAALSTTSDELYGYQSEDGTQGGFLAERAWANFYAPNNSDPYGNPFVTGQEYAIVTTGNPALNVTLTKNSDNNVWGPNANKLFGSYLDNGSSLTFNGLPKTGYDVAIIFAGDGGNFSRVTVNGVNKTYDADGNLVNGDSKWGNRATSANDLKQLRATGASTTGQVMYLADLSGETLTLQTYGDNGRGTIAAIQIYIHEASYSPVLEDASSYWTFENAFTDLKGTINWAGNNGWNNDDTDAYVESLRVNEEGEYNKAVKISDAFHPGPKSDYTFSNEFTAAAFVNVANCPDKGVIASFGDVCWLRKLNATETEPIRLCFGDATNNVTATIDNLTFGYHLVVVTKSTTGISIQIDNEAPVTSAENATLPTINSGFQLGVDWTGLSDDADQATNLLIDEFGIWNRVLKADEIAQLAGLIPAAYPLSMVVDKNDDDVISKTELDAVVGKATKWNVFGEVALQIEEDLGLTSLELVAMNSPTGDSLTITGAGSLYGNNFVLTTAIPVDITNQKNNPSITFSGAGDVTIRKGNGPTAGGIAPAMNNYTGTFTADDGQQITRMGGDLTIPFTVGANGAKLHSNDGNWTVSSKISGSGTLTIASPSRWIAVTNNANDFTGNVVVESGILYVGNKGSENSGSDAQLGDGNSTYTVKSGATFYTHLGGNNKTFAPNITLEEGAIFGNRDGHVTYSGDIAINGAASYNFYWNKQNTFSGVVSGSGTLTINGPDNEDGTCEIRLTNANNTFTGTYKLAGKNANRKIKLVACATTGAASYNLTNAYSILAFSGDVTAAALTGAAGTVESSTAGTARTVTLTGDSDVRALTVSNDIMFAVTAGETYITSTTKATVAEGATVKVVLTADQKLTGLTLENVTVDGGTVVFLDIDGTTELQSSESNAYEAAQVATYTVTAEGGSWNKDPETGDAITLAFGDIAERTLDESILPQGVTHLAGLTATGANASVTATFAAIADAVIVEDVEDALAIVGTAEETTIEGVISGAGKVKVTAGLVKFTNTNTYTGGTDIAADATLIMGNANAIGTMGAITGAGTLKFSGFVPANLSNITVADGGWTGTFYMMNRPSSGTFPVNEWGNANSTVCFENCSGYLTPAGGATVLPNIRVEGDGWRSQNGNGNAQFTFTGALSGSGKLEVATATPEAGNFYKFTGDVSGFTGYVNVTNNHRVVFGDANSQGNGKITIAKDVTIAAQKTWSAVNGIAIMEGATLTVNGAITGAIANAGVLTYKVDTTASNTFTGAGFIFADGEGVELDLSAATLTDFGGAFNAINGATIKLPYAATVGTTLSCDEDSTFVVVYSDAETEQNNLRAVTVTGTGTLQFVDEAGNALPSSGSTYVLPTYTVTAEGGSWNVTPLQNNKVVIDFGATAGSVNLTDEILGSVTTLSKLTVKGSNGGTITNSTVTACPTVEVLAGGRTNVPATLTSLATTVTGPIAEGSLLYVTGETTATTSQFPYTGNRHFETLKFTGAKTIGQGIDTYEVATGEKLEFHYNEGACYEQDLVVNGGTIATKQNTYVWLAGIANKTFTLKAGTADFSNVTVDDRTQGLLIGYQGDGHTFNIQGGTLDAPNTSIVAWEANGRYIQSGGTVKTKGFRQNGSNFTEMTLTGGTIELGSGGLPNLGMASASIEATTIHAVANNAVAEALNMTNDATLSAAANTTMTVTSTFTGTATLSIAGAGTVDLSGATIPNTIALNVAAESTATVVVSADQLSTFAQMIVPETATLKIKGLTADSLLVGRLNCTLGAESTLDGAIVLDGIEGETTTFTEGVLSVTFTANPTLIGNAWWWDYEFDGNVNSIGSDTAPLVLEGDGTTYVTVEGDNQALYFQKTPYRNNGDDVKARFAEVDAFTAVMYCQPGAYDNVPLVGFGSTTQDDKVAVVLATGAKAANGEMAILLVKGNNHVVTHLADNLVVPNATTAYHLYAFTFEAQETQTVISVYVDGKLKKTTIVNERFRVSNGFQIGSLHGGVMTEQTGLSKYSASGDSGTIDFLRVTKGVLSAEAMRKMAEVYKYESKNGEATRTIEDATADWVAEATWTQSGEDTAVAQPNEGTNVTLTSDIATEVTVNLEADVTYETLTVAGNAAVTFKKGAAKMTAGDITIGTDVTIEYGAIEVGTFIVNGGKTLTFDFTGYDFSAIYANTTIPLTGLATLGENARVTVSLPTLPGYMTAECVFDAKKSEYALAITVTGELSATIENSEITWKIGNVELENTPADFSAWATIPISVSVVGANTLTWGSVGILDAANCTFTVTGRDKETDALTMNVESETTLAMTLSTCSFTKAGEGTLKLASTGVELNAVNVTLEGGKLSLDWLGRDETDPVVENTTFIYVDANEDRIADGELTNVGWVHSTTTTTFIVPEGVTGRAVVGSCLTNTGAVVKQGAGTLVLGIMKTNNANPYTGATTVEAGTLAYHIVNSSSSAFVMSSAITVEAGAAIKGVENCTLASLTFEAGAIVDATDAPVTAAAVTLPEGEGAKVVLKKNASGDVLTYTGDVPNMNLFTTATTLENKALGLGVKVNEGVVTLVLTQVPVPEVTLPGATEDEIAKAQTEAEVAAQVVADALAASTDEETRTANVTAIENPGAASIIENAGVELTQNKGEETYTAKFTYDFGISAIKVVALNLDGVEGTELYVVVKAELDDDYSFANGVTVSVTDGENVVEGAVSVNENGEPNALTGNTRYFRFPLPTNRGTHSYRVRASK